MKIIFGVVLIIILILVLRIGELYTQLARYQRYWDRSNEKPVNKDDLVYIAFGDSAAQGVGASKPQNGYVGLLARQISNKTGRTVHVINLSKSGAGINDVSDTQLSKHEALDIKNKQIITLDIGANDVVRTGLENFENNMDKLMRKLPAQTLIADIPSFRGSRFAKLEARVNAANQIMEKLAKKHGFKLVSVHNNPYGSTSLRTFAADIFHPSDFGYKVNWTAPFWQRLSQDTDAM